MQDAQKKSNDEEEEAIVEEFNFDKPDFVFLPKGNHIYRQEGYYLVCRSCDLTHAVFIGPDKIMVGEKDGQPILKKRKDIGMV